MAKHALAEESSAITTYSFCDAYLDRLADYIEENYIRPGKDLTRLAIVFGGKRPALFLKRELSRRIKEAFYSPQFFAVNEFMAYTVRKHEMFASAADLDINYLLYQLAQKKTPEVLRGRETFAEFLPWTREILGFIDELDLENVPESNLLSVQHNADIGYDVPPDLNRLLQHIVVLRKAYHDELKELKFYSRGLQYLRAAQVVEKVDFDEFDEILICNFFYFTRCEEVVVKNLHARGKVRMIFQGDERKWPVLERIARKFDVSLREGKEPETPKFNLKLYSGFDAHSQVCLVREILKGIKHLDKTVIVLPNPDHIIPLISEISGVVQEFNISMGYPLKRSSLYSLFEFIFKTQASRKNGKYYAKDYLKVLRHPFVKNLRLSADPSVARILIHKIEEILTGKEKTAISGSLFLDLADIEKLEELYLMAEELLQRLGIKAQRKELQEVLQTIHRQLFRRFEEVSCFADFAVVLKELLDLLIHNSFLRNFPLNLNIAEKMYTIQEEFAGASFKDEKFLPDDIFRIFDAKVTQEIIAFHGSPLKGLQVLGLFETRSLNFENVIVLDINEGSLPKLNLYKPLIPREVMISLKLDSLELEEEIQRYQFMRLISSAKNVHLVYAAGKENEKSRFVEELIWEEEKKKNKIDIVPVTQGTFEVNVSSAKTKFKKTPEMIQFLKNMTYSASSINTYLRDPLEFYYSYVLGIKEQDDLLDEPEARQIGTFVHELLEEAFQPFLKKKPDLNAAFMDRFGRLFNKKFNETFEKSMKSDAFLLRSVLTERLHRFMKNEAENPARKVAEVLYLEKVFEDTIDLSCGPIKFKYIVDRVDRMEDGTVMIVDYKTGSISQMPCKIEKLTSLEMSCEEIYQQVRSFQLPLYFHYLDKQFKDVPINAALYNLRTLKIDKFIGDKVDASREYINGAYLRALDFVLSEILNPDIPFVEGEEINF